MAHTVGLLAELPVMHHYKDMPNILVPFLNGSRYNTYDSLITGLLQPSCLESQFMQVCLDPALGKPQHENCEVMIIQT